jgi:hypothetical protein
MGGSVVLDRTIPEGAHYLRFDRTADTAQGRRPHRCAKRIRVTDMEPGRFAEDARRFFGENHADEDSDQFPYQHATPLARWTREAGVYPKYDSDIDDRVRQYIGPMTTTPSQGTPQ